MDIEFFLQLTINGILLGGFYATMTLGFSIIWGVMRLINLAHGEFLLVGAYITWFFANPTRQQQDLVIGSNTPDEIHSTIIWVFRAIAVILALVLSELVLGDERIPQRWFRRIGSLLASGLIVFLIYQAWQSDDFEPVVLPMRDMVMVSLALALGFLLSHIVLPIAVEELKQHWEKYPSWIKHYEVWVRRVIAYLAAAGIVRMVYQSWKSGGFEPLDPFQMLPIILLIFFAMGYVLQRGLFNRLVEGPYLTMLLVTFAVRIIWQSIGLRIYTANPRQISTEYAGRFWTRADFTNDTFRLPVINLSLPNPLSIIPEKSFPAVTLPKDKTYVLIVCVFMIFGLVQFMRRTRTGQAIRAAAQNKMAARLMGINIRETYAITFGIALGLTGIAGAMMGTFQAITPVVGAPWTLRAFAIVALGGLGRIKGVVIGGLILGLVESYIAGYLPQINEKITFFEFVNATGWALAASFILLVVMLVLRPQGLTGGLKLEEES